MEKITTFSRRNNASNNVDSNDLKKIAELTHTLTTQMEMLSKIEGIRSKAEDELRLSMEKLAKNEVDSSNELQLYKNRQERIFENKLNHGFNTTNIYQEARYILEETAELMRAIEKNDMENLKEELADIVIFAYGCAAVARVGDLDEEIFKKMTINENREYHKTSEGDFVKNTSTEQE
jgi:NTP pyrophosphatase (non-canonical NTP hydrolase)